jgi:hypothetical protein
MTEHSVSIFRGETMEEGMNRLAVILIIIVMLLFAVMAVASG